MSIIISHHLAVEFYRNLRRLALPRPQSMKEWLTYPSRGIQLTQSGHVDLLTGSQLRRKAGKSPLLDAAACREVLQSSKLPTLKEASAIRASTAPLIGSAAPFHVLVDTRNKKRSAAHMKCHLVTPQLWDGALWQVSDDVFVSSPELVFIQMASVLPRPMLVRLGLELCGGYALNPNTTRGFDDTYAITTPQLLLDSISKAPKYRGSREALIAAQRVLVNSASPAESAVYIIFCFPRREGGYGVPEPLLNGKVIIVLPNGEEVERYCDLLLEGYDLAIEYLGTDAHNGWESVVSDATRQGDLAMSDITVIPLTKEHVGDIARLDNIAAMIKKRIGMRDRAISGFEEKQLELHKLLFPWAH